MTSRHENARLRSLRALDILDSPPEAAYDGLVRLAAQLAGTPMAVLTMLDVNRQWFKASVGLGVSETPRSQAFCAFTVEAGASFVVEDASLDPRFRENPLVTQPPSMRFYAGVPLRAPDGTTPGALAVIDTRPRQVTTELLAQLEALAEQASALLELRWQRHHLQLLAARLDVANQVAGVGSWTYYPESGRIDYSNAALDILGTDPAAFGYRLADLMARVPEFERPALEQAIRGCAEGGQALDLEHSLINQDGSLRIVHQRGMSLPDPSGEGRLLVGCMQDLTQQRQALDRLAAQQTALERAHAELSFHIANSPLAMIEWDEQFRVRRWSRRASELFGWTEEEVLGLAPGRWHFVHPEDAASVDAIMRELLDGRAPRNVSRNRNSTRDGSVLHCVWYNSVLHSPDGSLASIFSLIQDVSAQVEANTAVALALDREREAKLQLQQSQALLRMASSLSRTGAWSVDLDPPQSLWSDEVRAMFEFDDVQAPSLETAISSFTAQTQPIVQAAADTLLKGGGPVDIEAELIGARGGRRWVRAMGEAVRDSQERVIRLQGALQDISGRKRQEIERTRAEAALRVSEERFRLLSRATDDAIWDWDLKAGTLWWNEGVETLFGVSREELEPGIESWSNRVHPEDRARVVREVDEALAGNASQWTGQYRFRRADGSYATVMDRGYVIRDERGVAVRMVGGLTDLSERIALEEQLQQIQRLESIGQLTGGIAHDFNNLLTVIQGNAELLVELLADQPRLADLARMIDTASLRGSELTHRLLAFARRQTLEPKPTDINLLLQRMQGLLARSLGGHIDIRFEPGPELWRASVDPGQLESAVLNLCINARDAMGESGTLHLSTVNHQVEPGSGSAEGPAQGEYVLVTVSDTGSGVPPEHLPRIFEPFYTTKARGKGTGLGLAMVYGFVKQSRGHVSLASVPGSGTTVRLYLPRVIGNELEPAAEDAQPRAPGCGACILVVEDEPLVRRYACDQLQALGYRVIEAENGPEAIEKLKAHCEIDLLFTDVVMPGGMSGRQLAESAQALRPGLRVLYTSGYTEGALMREGRLDAGIALLGKPYRRADLAGKLREVLA